MVNAEGGLWCRGIDGVDFKSGGVKAVEDGGVVEGEDEKGEGGGS